MNKIHSLPLLIALLCLLFSCGQNEHKINYDILFNEAIEQGLSSSVSYADGFDMYQMDDVYRLDIYEPGLAPNIMASFYLSAKFKNDHLGPDQKMIGIPLDSVAVFSGTQINAFDKLGLLHQIVGVSEGTYIKNATIVKGLKEGSIVELGNNGAFYLERSIQLRPNAIFYSPYKVNETNPLAATQITMIPFFDFLEEHPLGRAEWLKFTALFYGKSKEADSIFSHIVGQYESYRLMAQNPAYRPTVFSDKYFNGQWYIPGGQSYIARLFKDSGAQYLWEDDLHKGSFPLDYEVVFAKASEADFWRIVGSYGDSPTYEALLEENGLYRHFKAFKERHIIHCDAQATAYFEASPMEPHILLADLIKAFHPELLPDYTPSYYRILP